MPTLKACECKCSGGPVGTQSLTRSEPLNAGLQKLHQRLACMDISPILFANPKQRYLLLMLLRFPTPSWWPFYPMLLVCATASSDAEPNAFPRLF